MAGNLTSAMARLLLLAVLAFASHQSWAQPYPNRPIRFIVPYPAGGGTDIIARMLGGKLAEAWGQQVVVENRAGASGILGNDLVAKAAATARLALAPPRTCMASCSIYRRA